MSESTALAVVEDITAPVVADGLPHDCRRFLELFMRTRYICEAAAIMGISRNRHRRWMDPDKTEYVPGFREAFEDALDDVRDQEYDLLGKGNERGLKEQVYDAEGNLKHTRFRQSEGLIKMRLQALDPDRYVHDKMGTNKTVVVVVNRTNEGGWTE